MLAVSQKYSKFVLIVHLGNHALLEALNDRLGSKKAGTRRTPLWAALENEDRHGHYRTIRLLLKRGADPNVRSKYSPVDLLTIPSHLTDHRNVSPLLFALRKGYLEVVELLLTYNADVNAHGMCVLKANYSAY
jgi:ankyrin repeat protein